MKTIYNSALFLIFCFLFSLPVMGQNTHSVLSLGNKLFNNFYPAGKLLPNAGSNSNIFRQNKKIIAGNFNHTVRQNAVFTGIPDNKIHHPNGNNSDDVNHDRRSIHFFPLFSSREENSLSVKYSELLKSKLIKSEVFKINDSGQMNSILENSNNIYSTVKKKIDEVSSKSGIESVIYGYIIKINNKFNVKLYLYNAKDKIIVSSFQDNIYEEIDCERSARRCAVEFCSRMLSISSSRYFFASMIMPGLGQFLKKKYIRGALFSSSFVYLFAKLSSLKSQYVQTMSYRSERYYTGSSYTTRYYINNSQVSYNEYISSQNKYNKSMQNRNEISQQKQKYALGLATVYLVNIADMLISIKSMNSKRIIENRLNFSAVPLNDGHMYTLTYRF